MTQRSETASSLRSLQLADLPSAAEEARSLLATGYTQRGNWSLGQICRHLRMVQDPSMDGYPGWLSLFAPFRPLMRKVFMGRVLRFDSPRGVPTAPVFKPPNDVDDAAEVEALAQSVERFRSHEGKMHPHPAFGKLDRQRLEQVHAAHAAHHLRFLEPREEST